ncbi:Retrovirus-related Pol polyprotein from transposon TNT 1-94 [Gossypium australe]|uniref:Retrovirus-related Pol polyprotein from transposon TNT 1-94 n=1 Tax=Gossypium australe TaxID=47621 RepID=A0A5B6WN53_9ROSI|nr:Retrovirus-related Pol polyprotein from transposon TNT 1-94 [Gossypium australe]
MCGPMSTPSLNGRRLSTTQENMLQQLVVPYTPQQNGVSERKNRTIIEMARCLLFEKDLPKVFWAEAVNTLVYLLNLLPTRVLVGHIMKCGMYQSSSSKGYKLYNVTTKKVFVSRNVKFDEHTKWNWEKNEIAAQTPIVVSQEQISKSKSDTKFAFRGTRSLYDVYAMCNLATLEPTNYKEVAKHNELRAAMIDEMKMIKKNSTWQLVDRPKNYKVIGVKWVYRTKLNQDGSVNKHKARFVSAFLNGLLEEEIFFKQQEGFQALENEGKAPRAWYSRIDSYLLQKGFTRSESEATLYYILGNQFDSGVFISQRKYALEVLMKFKMKNCKPIATLLVLYEKLSKSDNFEKVDASIYRCLIGNLLYLSAIRPYITGAFAWNSKKQDMVAQSSTEAKYVSTAVAANQAIWLRKILANLDKILMMLLQFRLGEINVRYCKSEDQFVDVLTKVVSRPKFEFLRRKLGVSKKNLKEEY